MNFSNQVFNAGSALAVGSQTSAVPANGAAIVQKVASPGAALNWYITASMLQLTDPGVASGNILLQFVSSTSVVFNQFMPFLSGKFQINTPFAITNGIPIQIPMGDFINLIILNNGAAAATISCQYALYGFSY